jgi:hypothetical protein
MRSAAVFRLHAAQPRQKARVAKRETVMSDYLAMFSAVAVYGAFFYFIWAIQ